MTSQLLFSIATLLLTTDLEALLLNNGCMELEDPARNFQEHPTLPQYIISKEKVRALREALNKPEIVKILEQD